MTTTGEAWLDAVTREVAKGAADGTDASAWVVSEVNGQTVSDNDLSAAVDRLQRWGCVKPLRRLSSKMPSDLLPLDRVHEIPHIAGSLREHFEGRTHYDQRSTHISGGQFGAAQFGDHNTQNISSQTFNHDERQQILGVIDGIVGNARNHPELAGLVEEISGIREAVEAGEDRPTIKERVGNAFGTLAKAGSTAVVSHAALQSLAHLQSLI